MIEINYGLQHFMLTHLLCIVLFTYIYCYFFDNSDKHYILNSNISKEEYYKNRIINSLYLSVNLQTTTGYVDFYIKSTIARIVTMTQLFLSLLITIGYIHLTKIYK